MQSGHIIITGCSSGFGLEMAQRFSRAGWHVLATSRSAQAPAISSETLHFLQANIAEQTGRDRVNEYVSAKWGGRVDCLVNNAGFGLNGPFECLTEAQIRGQMEVNVFAAMLLTKTLLPALRAAKGRVINISSVLGYTGMPMSSLYSASKFALEGWSESLHYELQSQGVQVGIIEPGGFRTDFAQNIQWAEADASTVVYQAPLDNVRGFFSRKLGSEKGKGPQAVAAAVVSLAARHRMPLRTRVGHDAQALYFFRRVLPQRMTDALLRRFSRKMMGMR